MSDEPRKTYVDALAEARAAGGHAWDQIPDPEAYLREIRGEVHPDLPRLAREACEAWDRYMGVWNRDDLYSAHRQTALAMQRLREVCDAR